MVLVDAGCAGQIARRTVLSGHAEDVAARREQRPLTVRRQREIHLPRGVRCANLTLDVRHAAASTRTVVREQDGNLLEVLARQIQSVKLASLLEGDCIAAQRREIDIVIGEVRDLPRLPGIRVP